ncbi:hypothetical protein [Motilibacter aurantiacus]|uniref:hypothetical protein n=1 Tax=Motilibacter aurantiacus TaxID=2714955 RepID=UPI0014078694|nr:hypothetical protein [Motilibacter aurantiacus]NHC47607.1 hypothetical protein [Motilibacter aurantiacus]
MDSLLLDVAVGLVFVYAVAAAVTTIVTEGIARFLGLRARFLLLGIRTLVDGRAAAAPAAPAPADAFRGFREGIEHALPCAPPPGSPEALDNTEALAEPAPAVTSDEDAALRQVSVALLGSPLLRNQGQKGQLAQAAPRRWGELRKLPSYAPSRSFAQAVVDLLIPDQQGRTTFDALERAVGALPEGTMFKQSMQTLLKNTEGDVAAFRENVENWYDDHMDRVSGWYKRRVRWISLAVGFFVVVLCNVNTVSVARALYTDQALREAVVTQALAASDCGGEADECLAQVRREIGSLRGSGLPVGWGSVADCTATARALRAQAGEDATACTWAEARGLASATGNGGADVWFGVRLGLGFLLSWLALVPGARFWFDLLGRLGSLRSTGPRPARAVR